MAMAWFVLGYQPCISSPEGGAERQRCAVGDRLAQCGYPASREDERGQQGLLLPFHREQEVGAGRHVQDMRKDRKRMSDEERGFIVAVAALTLMAFASMAALFAALMMQGMP